MNTEIVESVSRISVPIPKFNPLLPKSVIIENCANPIRGYRIGNPGLVWHKIQESLTLEKGCWYLFLSGRQAKDNFDNAEAIPRFSFFNYFGR